MPGIVVEMTSQEAKLFAGLQRIVGEQKKMEQGLGNVAKKSREAEREQQAMAQAAKRMYEQTRTPQERYNQKLREMGIMLKAGKIDQDTFNRALVQAKQEFAAAGQAGKSAFGSDLKNQIMSVVGVLGISGGIAGALTKIKSLAQDAKQEIKGIAEGLNQSHEGLKQLWQVSESKKVYEELSAGSKLAMAKEGLTREQAQDLTFNLKSLDRLEALPVMAKASRFMQSDIAGKFYSTLSSDVNWGLGIGAPENVLSGLIAGAGKSSFNTSGTATWMAQVAPFLKATGATPAEMMGVGGAISPAARGDATSLGTLMQALGKEINEWKAEKDEKTGLLKHPDIEPGILAGFRAFQKDTEAYEAKKISNVRFGQAAGALEGALDLAERNTKYIAGAFSSPALFQAKTVLPPELNLQQQRQVAAKQKEVALEEQAMAKIRLQTAIDRNKALAGFADTSFVVEKGWEAALEAGSTVGMVEEATRVAEKRLMQGIYQHYPKVAAKEIGPGVERVMPGAVGMDGAGAIAFDRTIGPPKMTDAARADAIVRAMDAIAERHIKASMALDKAADKLDQAAERQAQPARPLLANPGEDR